MQEPQEQGHEHAQPVASNQQERQPAGEAASKRGSQQEHEQVQVQVQVQEQEKEKEQEQERWTVCCHSQGVINRHVTCVGRAVV